jgi:hypothetical protein
VANTVYIMVWHAHLGTSPRTQLVRPYRADGTSGIQRQAAAKMMTYLPLKLFVGYIIATLLISFYGPMEYEGYDRISVAIYITAFLIIFSLSYGFGVRRTRHIRSEPSQRPSARTIELVKWCIAIAFLVKGGDLVVGLMTNGFHLSLGEIGNNYYNLYADYVRNSGRQQNLMFFVNLPLTLPIQAAMILGTYYFKSLRRPYRVMLVSIFLAVLLANTIGQGKQKQLGDIVIFLMSVGLIKHATPGGKFRRKTLLLLAALAVLAIAAFAFILKLRYSTIGITAVNYNAKASAQTWMNFDHLIFRLLGQDLGFPVAMLLTGYLSGGYYGLSLCLALPFKWTYFLGSSYSLMVAFSRFVGTPFLLEATYPLRMEDATGYSAMTKWHTIFPWLASDFTFVGTLFVLGATGYVYAICWKEAIARQNPVSILLFAVMTLGLVFVPGNNQLMIAPDGVIALWALIILWLLKRRSYEASSTTHRASPMPAMPRAALS